MRDGGGGGGAIFDPFSGTGQCGGFDAKSGLERAAVFVQGGFEGGFALAFRCEAGEEAAAPARGADGGGGEAGVGAAGRAAWFDGGSAIWRRAAAAGMRAAAGEGRGFWDAPDHGARRQGGERPGDDAAAAGGRAFAGASGEGQGAPRA